MRRPQLFFPAGILNLCFAILASLCTASITRRRLRRSNPLCPAEHYSARQQRSRGGKDGPSGREHSPLVQPAAQTDHYRNDQRRLSGGHPDHCRAGAGPAPERRRALPAAGGRIAAGTAPAGRAGGRADPAAAEAGQRSADSGRAKRHRDDSHSGARDRSGPGAHPRYPNSSADHPGTAAAAARTA